jgi:hypothetical protein
LTETGIWRNPEESIVNTNSCPAGIHAKNSCESGEKQDFLRPPPKPRSSEKFLRKTQEKNEILKNPGRNGLFGPKNKFLKTGIICNLGHHKCHKGCYQPIDGVYYRRSPLS